MIIVLCQGFTTSKEIQGLAELLFLEEVDSKHVAYVAYMNADFGKLNEI